MNPNKINECDFELFTYYKEKNSFLRSGHYHHLSNFAIRIYKHKPGIVVFGGFHVYYMNYGNLLKSFYYGN